ncbi:ABC transporter substrate-binding protein [Phytohabitans sp. ZYX-F-186]|uniref:ABC transporter substrate-binding protein n=1 Tax=Phytohabitans maris TaxID=3071409 RepID=A0ABU0ZSU8_9ACTN|nr:ABC transporter substrate-binding protein [Phytohabitans sp. ZYX-F-186]MDQ7910111.1 ABC transporter substrate-binding protein [Phytohabitans sp. ZYX-F-186]
MVAVATEPSTLDPQLVNDRSSRIVTDNVFETLLVRDGSAQIQPKLADSYERVDDTTWRFVLHPGVTFHDGSPLDADAVVFSIERIIDPEFDTQRTSYTEGIAGAKKVDDRTVDILTDGKNPVLPAEMTSIPMVSPASAQQQSFGHEVVVGTGPYTFKSWQRGREIQLERHDGYWAEKPSIPAFTVRVVPDAQTALSALQAGEVDLVFDLFPEQSALAPQVKEVQASDFSYVAFNTYKKELSDPRVRRAMNLAVDKESLAKTIYQGHASPNQAQHLAKGMLGFSPGLAPFPYDPEQAKRLLAEAGYPDGFDLELHVPIGRYSKGEESADFVAAALDAVGVHTKVVKHDWNDYRTLGRVKGTEQDAFDLKYGWNSNEWFDAARIKSHITCEGASSKFCNKSVDQLVDAGANTFDQADRQRDYEQMWATLHDDPYSIYLLQQHYIFGTSKRLVWDPRPDDAYFVSTMKLTS